MRILIFVFAPVLLALTSCFEPFEESIYEDSEPRMVIEANISNANPPYEVKLSRSVYPGDDINEAQVNNAIVQLSNELGDQVYFQPLGEGRYYLSGIEGQPDVSYYLDVFIEDEVYTAHDKMPHVPAVDSLAYDFIENYLDGDGYYFTLFMNKRKDTISYYKVNISLHDSLFNDYADLLIFDDSYTLESYEILLPYAFEVTDSVVIDIFGISRNLYDYYYGLSNQTTNLFSNIQPPMLNPTSNFSNNALGYFQAASIVSLDTVIHEIIEN